MPQPRLDELFVSYLQQRSTAALAEPAVRESEVELHHAASLAIVDARQAFNDAIAVVGWLCDDRSAVAHVQSPPGWGAFVHEQDTVVPIPFCVGHYPQMLRDVAPLLSAEPPSSLLAETADPQEMNDVAAWGTNMLRGRRWAEATLAAAVLRMTRQEDKACNLLGEVKRAAPAGWQPLLGNEEAALAWAAGDRRRAADLWTAHPLPARPPILFNRGLAALFADRTEEAGKLLHEAVQQLPESSPWHHLGQLYLALAHR